MDTSLNLEEKYRYLVENTKDVFYTLDLEGKFVDISFSGEALTGYKVEEWLGKDFAGIISEPTRPLAVENFYRVVQEQCELEFEIKIVTKSGEERVVELGQKAILSSGRVVGVQGVARDVTERKRLEEEVQEHSRNLQKLVEDRTRELERLKIFNEQIIEQNALGIIVVDKSLHVAKWNQAAAKIFHISANVALGRPLAEVHSCFRSPEIRSTIETILQRGTPGRIERCSAAGEAGEEKNLQLSLSSLSNRGEVTGTCILVEDITERENAELDLKRRTEELAILNTVASTVNRSLDPNQVSEKALEELMSFMKASKGGVYLRTGEMMLLTTCRGISPKFESSVGELPVDKVSTIIPWFHHEKVASGSSVHPFLLEEGIENTLTVPLVFEGKLSGILVLSNYDPDTYQLSGPLLLETIANQVSVAIENARLYALEQKKSLRLALINEVFRRVNTILDLDVLLKQLVRLIRETFKYYNVNITIIEGEEIIFKAGYVEGRGHLAGEGLLRVGAKSIIGWVAEKGEPLLVRDVGKDPRYLYHEGLPNTRSELAVPILFKKQVAGILDVQNDRVEGLDEGDLELIQALAAQIGGAVENALLFKRLDTSRKEYSDLYENAPAMYHSLSPKGIILSVNRAEAGTLGYSKEDIVGHHFTDFLTEDSKKKFKEHFEVLQGKGSVNYEIDLINSKGEIVNATMSCVLRRDREGRPLKTLSILKDVTQLKRLEQQLIQSEKMALLGEMGAGLAHEVRNPLSGIRGAVEVLGEAFGEKDSRREVVEEILNQITRLDRLVKGLLTYARPTEFHFVPVDIHHLLESILTFMENEPSRKGMKIERRLLASHFIVQADSAQIEQVFQNLILNAFQAMSPGGVLTLATEEKDGMLCISIKDTGKGISDNLKKDIFRPFFSGKAQGTGLGLAIVERIVEAHMGKIMLETSEGVGTTVTIFLPLDKS